MRYLAHHGVKGQQWGLRNGPPYPIEVLQKFVSRMHQKDTTLLPTDELHSGVGFYV